MEVKMCVLDEDKECDGCLECEICDLDPNKVCDNCGKCLDIKDVATIVLERINKQEIIKSILKLTDLDFRSFANIDLSSHYKKAFTELQDIKNWVQVY